MKQVTIANKRHITRESQGYKGIRKFHPIELHASAGLLTQVSLLEDLNL